MEETLMDKISRVRALEETTKELKQLAQKEEEKLSKLQESCNHVIIIAKLRGGRGKVEAKCLFCNQHYLENDTDEFEKIPRKHIVNAYESERYKQPYFKYSYTDSIYIDIKTYTQKMLVQKTMTESEIAEELRQWLKVKEE